MAFSVVNLRLGYKNRLSSLKVGSVLAAFVMLGTLISTPASAAGETLTAVSNKTTTYGSAVSLSQLQIQDADADTEMTIRIYAPSGSFEFGSTDNITLTGDTPNDKTITGLRSDINSALADLTYNPSQPGSVTIEARIGAGAVNPANNHAYLVVPAGADPEDEINWEDAKTAAAAMTYGGVNGYLATISSQQEHDFIMARINGDGWIGASDNDVEGEWRWVTGPEAAADSGQGLLFWNGNYSGSVAPGQFANWSRVGSGEPNNSGGGENCAQLRISEGGKWNDLSCNTTLPYYIVEFGSPGALPVVQSQSFTVTTTAQTRNVSNCAELLALGNSPIAYDTINLTNDIDCANEETLYNDSVFSKTDDTSFRGTFNGYGHTIRNLSLSSEGGPLGLFGYSNGATFNNLKVDNLDYGGGGNVGGLVGLAIATNFTNINMNNVKMDANNRAGGLAGYVRSGTIENVHVSNADINVDNYGGGIVGVIDAQGGGSTTVRNVSVVGGMIRGGDVGGAFGGVDQNEHSQGSILIEKAYSDLSIESSGSAGGLIGSLNTINNAGSSTVSMTTTLQNSYSWSSVSAPEGDYVGGLIGMAEVRNIGSGTSTMTIQNTYASGDVEADGSVGGLIGFLWVDNGSAAEVSSSFAKGVVTVRGNSNRHGGLVGEMGGNALGDLESSNNFYDQSGTGQASCSQNNNLSSCTAVNTDGSEADYFINNQIEAPMNAWDFESIWVVNAGVPPTFGIRSDTDPISIEVENAGPNNGDANDDGIPDSQQSNVASFVNPQTDKYVVLAVDEECSITAVSMVAEDTTTSDAGYQYPLGLMNFSLDCGTDGFTANVSQYYYDVSGEFAVRKYNPTTKTYQAISSANTSSQTIGGQSAKLATYQIQDGGALDLDGQANGTIVDPAGLAQTTNSGSTQGSLANTGENTIQLMLISLGLGVAGIGILYGMKRYSVSSR